MDLNKILFQGNVHDYRRVNSDAVEWMHMVDELSEIERMFLGDSIYRIDRITDPEEMDYIANNN